ncbi:putative glycoside hydrolase [soil metagenome]
MTDDRRREYVPILARNHRWPSEVIQCAIHTPTVIRTKEESALLDTGAAGPRQRTFDFNVFRMEQVHHAVHTFWVLTALFAGFAITLLTHGALTVSANQSVPHEIANSIEGTVTDLSGEPVYRARVTDGSELAITDANGMFSLQGSTSDLNQSLRIGAAGYDDWSAPVSELDGPIEVALSLRPIRALYLNPTVTTSEAQLDRLIDIVNTTNANAVVIDIKEEWVYYDSQVAFFRDAGTVRPAYDISSLLQEFRNNDIYTIARLVVFKDSTVASVYPHFAITDLNTGEPWRDINGVAWVNPMLQELWEPNVDLAVEAANHGFDEIQYDYVRFPTDGDLSTMDFGAEYSQQGREQAIEGFLALSRQRLLPTGAKQSADVFGFTMVVDYLSPMVYPSHYSVGQFGLPGHPNDFPYEMVDISLQGGVLRLGGHALQIRPWLQDFDYFGQTSYGAAQVRAQIEAANAHGVSGWMLWDPENRYRLENLDAE